MSRWAIPAGLTWLFVQCDQMAFIVFIIGTLTTMKNCPIVYKIYQSLEQFLPNTKQTLIKLPKTVKFLPKWQNFAKSGHTDVRFEGVFLSLTHTHTLH